MELYRHSPYTFSWRGAYLNTVTLPFTSPLHDLMLSSPSVLLTYQVLAFAVLWLLTVGNQNVQG